MAGRTLRYGGVMSPHDCELIRLTFPAQPVAAFTALAFVVAGVWTIGRRRTTGPLVFGLSLVVLGATSFWFHAEAGAPASAAESLAVIATMAWLAVWASSRPDVRAVWVWLATVAAAGLVIGIAPATRHGLTAAAIAAFAVGAIRNPRLRRDRRMATALGIFSGALVVYVLSRTGGPWCDPASPIQGHGLWHLLSALALVFVGEATGASEKGTPA